MRRPRARTGWRNARLRREGGARRCAWEGRSRGWERRRGLSCLVDLRPRMELIWAKRWVSPPRFLLLLEATTDSEPTASLPKDSLLTILTSLITTNPALRPTIQALLPPPSLTTTLTALTTLERAVVSSLPTGLSLRDPYIWGRVRIPLETYVTESKTFLTSFCPAVLPPHLASDESHHPSTTFALLHALSSSLRRLEVVLPPSPSPIDTHLLPYLLNAWHIFLTRLSTAVNQEGKIVSAGMLRGWFARIDELCVDSPGIGIGGRREGSAKKALEGVRERMRKEVGWVVGIKEVGVGMMEDEEEL